MKQQPPAMAVTKVVSTCMFRIVTGRQSPLRSVSSYRRGGTHAPPGGGGGGGGGAVPPPAPGGPLVRGGDAISRPYAEVRQGLGRGVGRGIEPGVGQRPGRGDECEAPRIGVESAVEDLSDAGGGRTDAGPVRMG